MRHRKLDAPYRLNSSHHPARFDPSLEPRRSAVLISALATHGGRLGPFLAA